MSGVSRSVVTIAALTLGVVDLAVLNLYLGPKVLDARDGVEQGQGPALVDTTPARDAGPGVVRVRVDAAAAASTRANDAGAGPGDIEEYDAATEPADAGMPELADASVDAAVEIDAAVAVAVPGDFEERTYTFYFAQDRATLKVHHEKDLDEAVALLQQYPAAIAVIEGHADESETRYGITSLIKRRIGKIEKYLTEKSIAPERIRTVNRGSVAGANDAETSGHRWARLRVEMP